MVQIIVLWEQQYTEVSYTEKKVELKWFHRGTLLGKRSHFWKVAAPKQYLKGGHPVDMEMAPLWGHFDSTFCLSV